MAWVACTCASTACSVGTEHRARTPVLLCRYTELDRPEKPRSNVEIVERAAVKAQLESLDTGDSRSSSNSTACPPFDPADWPFALRTKEAADLFRKRAYRAARVPEPSEDPVAVTPKQITVVSAADGEVVGNKVRSILLRASGSVPRRIRCMHAW